ncbi:CopG family nickel-responsive transcriptional regulator [Palleronia aestuarii]|uniref:Putative nickel-responsive regulator n=1 Tax=Palleronia aestuarii TaxID=568105 RepID=A0A2W7N212_9RHOB|nr:nickel-responsive transcriptional regulator NikR [Palleronia aestuarii]PZX13733.1 CopG family nickel-responsive transcriptional regulator [Palleronia aestuarii]
MPRITVSIEDHLLAELDAYMDRSGATNRSEAVRELIRRSLGRDAPDDAECIGVLSYALELSTRDLSRRVPQNRHARHDQAVATISVPIDHDVAVEVTVMRGALGGVEDFANGLFSERGVRHGRLALIPVETTRDVHSHGGAPHAHAHYKIRDGF